MDTNYMCVSWQALLQMIVHLVGRGYYFYCLTHLPENKRARWNSIDRKLIDRYQTDKSKFQRARCKSKKIANFYYLRWENISILLHTTGELRNIEYIDHFSDIRRQSILLAISELISFSIGINAIQSKGETKTKVFVRLSRESYRGVKNELVECAKSKNKYLMKLVYDRLNGLPAYSGIIDQKRNLAKFLSRQAKRHGSDFKSSQLRIHTRLKKHKVYSLFPPQNGEIPSPPKIGPIID